DAGAACNGGSGVVSDYKTRQSGWYLQGVYQFTQNWRAGLRYDRLDSGSRNFGANDASIVNDSYTPKRLTVMADYSWSEFSRMRLQFAQDKSMQGVTDNQIWLQYIMSLGAHGAHKF
ncbi:MAG: TonB-dependent receptor, partial [Rhodocyclaceae bacterium]